MGFFVRFFNFCKRLELIFEDVEIFASTRELNFNGFFGKSPTILKLLTFTWSNFVEDALSFLFWGFWILTKNGLPVPRTKLDLSSPPIHVNLAVVPPNFSKRNCEISPSTLSYSEIPWKLQILHPLPEQFEQDFCFCEKSRTCLTYLPDNVNDFDLTSQDSSFRFTVKTISGSR